MPDLPFAKGQALGNDYLILDAAELPWRLTPERVRALCDRSQGVGADGVLLAVIGEDRFQLRTFNPDGSEAEKSGNGLRIFAAYLHDHSLVGLDPFAVHLPDEIVTLHILRRGEGADLQISAEMGRYSFQAAAIGLNRVRGEVESIELELGDDLSATIYPVSIGNPHSVVRVDRLDRADFLRRAPRLTVHDTFSAGTNVQFAEVTGANSLRIWVYERGAGETRASGSSASAVAAVAQRLGWVERGRTEVEMDGGLAIVEIDQDRRVRLEGPAQIVYRGVVRGEIARSW